MSYRVVCWGMGKDYDFLQNSLLREEEKGDIVIVARIDRNRADKSTILSPEDLDTLEYDYIIITSSDYYDSIRKDILRMGIDEERIVNGRILTEDGFDFVQYAKRGWLGNRIINNILQDFSYLDEHRLIQGKRIAVEMGRKSYVAGMQFITEGFSPQIQVLIGNYTSISRNVSIETGLNLDHDYRRILNYGISHLKGMEKNTKSSLNQREYLLSIGSDVWIGENSIIKAGITIGTGAVVASNSYVVGDVPAYAIIGGNPAKVIKYRFSSGIIEKLLLTEWWNCSEEELVQYRQYFDDPEKFINVFAKNKNMVS